MDIENLQETVLVVNPTGHSSVALVCEHASSLIPETYANLGLAEQDQLSHAARDPGAMAVAMHLSKVLDAVLVASGVSRLVYDCNRPPSAPDAMPARSEVVEVPGNVDLSSDEKAKRVAAYYLPFRDELRARIQAIATPVIVTIHSFTPVYHGKRRSVEIGILHDTDTRLADAMLKRANWHVSFEVKRNAPYGASDGVTHTLQEHAIKEGHLNVMLEIRNDLISTQSDQERMATLIAGWLVDACAQLGVNGVAECSA